MNNFYPYLHALYQLSIVVKHLYLEVILSPYRIGGGHIVIAADPVCVGLSGSLGVKLNFLQDIS